MRGKVGGRFKEESNRSDKEGKQSFNKPNEKARAEDETETKEKTEANVKEDASLRPEAENQAEASSSSCKIDAAQTIGMGNDQADYIKAKHEEEWVRAEGTADGKKEVTS